MPMNVAIETKFGTKVNGTAKWSPEEFEALTGMQLVNALEEMYEYANYVDTYVDIPRKDTRKRVADIEVSYKSTKGMLIGGSIAAGVTLTWWLMNKIANKHFLAFMCGFLFLVAAVWTVVMLFSFKKAKKAYQNELPGLKNYLEQIDALERQIIDRTHVDQMATGLVALPNYYQYPNALAFMADAVRNHRANTVAQAVNLYEREKQHLQQMSVMRQQLAAQQEAAAAAQQAAASAQAAANSAHTTAMNSFYDRNK